MTRACGRARTYPSRQHLTPSPIRPTARPRQDYPCGNTYDTLLIRWGVKSHGVTFRIKNLGWCTEMSYNVQFNDGSGDEEEQTFFLGSGAGIALFSAWIDSLPGGEFPHLVAFVTDGMTGDTASLSGQLRIALADHKPDNEVVTEIATVFLDRIGVGDEDEVAILTEE